MDGVIAICKSMAIGHVINDLELLLECYSESDMRIISSICFFNLPTAIIFKQEREAR